MTNRVEPGGPDAGRPAGCPVSEEDAINLLKAAERSGRENWKSDAAGGYTDRDGHHRDRYGDREGANEGGRSPTLSRDGPGR